MIDQMKTVFKEEASELLSTLETVLIELEKSPNDSELIDKVFRALHTIKGSSGMFGFDNISSFTHNIETVYDFIRNGAITITIEIISLTLRAKDQIILMLEETGGINESEKDIIKEIETSFEKIISDHRGAQNSDHSRKDEEVKKLPDEELNNNTLYYIRFYPSEDIFSNGTNPLLLLNDLSELGICFTKANTEKIPSLSELNPEKCYINWDIILITKKDINAVKDVFIFVEDDCLLDIQKTSLDKESDSTILDKIESFVLSREKITIKELKQIINGEKKNKEQNALINKKLKDESSVKKQKHNDNDAISSIRVNSDKLDCLVNLVSELVTVQARLHRTAEKLKDSELNSVAEEVERLTWELRDNALNIRMLPIGTVFSKFQRLVRDLSKELGKEVELLTDGADTELDKTVIEKLNDPLIHIIRNCIDHGIEPASIRKGKGKKPSGKIILSAEHSGANVVIKIKDDGAGIKKEAVIAKAKERNLITSDTELTEKDIYNLILLPGFSTAQKVSSVSGRGVGMDVVKRTIESLRGIIEIESSENSGTTIILKLPLTLAIIEGLLVKINDEYFVVPLSIVEECVEIADRKNHEINNRHLLSVRGELIPYIPLRDHFIIKGDTPTIEQIVVIREDDKKIGFVVDQVIGENQTVIKSLGSFYRNVEGVSGATILGDGTVALILDIPKLVQLAEIFEKELAGN